MGDSAGGYLSALVALAGDSPAYAHAYPDDSYASVSTKVKAVIGVYGHYDMIAVAARCADAPRRQHYSELYGLPANAGPPRMVRRFAGCTCGLRQ
jgi:acetyl esterase/lipase